MQLGIVDSTKASWSLSVFTPRYVQLLTIQRFNLNKLALLNHTQGRPGQFTAQILCETASDVCFLSIPYPSIASPLFPKAPD